MTGFSISKKCLVGAGGAWGALVMTLLSMTFDKNHTVIYDASVAALGMFCGAAVVATSIGI